MLYTSQNNFEKNDKVGRISVPDFRTYCKATVIKTMWCQWRDEGLDQWNRIGCPAIDKMWIVDKGTKAIQWTRESLQYMVLGQLNTHMQKYPTKKP